MKTFNVTLDLNEVIPITGVYISIVEGHLLIFGSTGIKWAAAPDRWKFVSESEATAHPTVEKRD